MNSAKKSALFLLSSVQEVSWPASSGPQKNSVSDALCVGSNGKCIKAWKAVWSLWFRLPVRSLKKSIFAPSAVVVGGVHRT